MPSITAYRPSDKRPELDTTRGRMPINNKIYTATDNPSRRDILKLLTTPFAAAACESSNPTGPTDPTLVSLQVYNATTGQGKNMTYGIPSGRDSVSVSGSDLASGLGDAVTSEFAVRTNGEGIGSLVTAAGSQANIRAGNYQVFVPATATRPNEQSVYDCMPAPRLNGNKRDFVVGVLHKPGVDTNNLPMYVWIDAIAELNSHMQSDNGMEYGSISFDANELTPDLTVGFADNNLQGGGAWAEGYTSAFMAGPRSVFPLDYDRATTKDSALEELFEMIFRHNNICGTGSREVIGKAIGTNDVEWGLNDAGVHLVRRNFTRAR